MTVKERRWARIAWTGRHRQWRRPQGTSEGDIRGSRRQWKEYLQNQVVAIKNLGLGEVEVDDLDGSFGVELTVRPSASFAQKLKSIS